MAQTNPNQPSEPEQKKVVVPVNKQPQPSWKPSANQQARLNQMYKDWETKENKTYVSRDGTSYRPAPKTDVTVPEGTRQFSYWEHPQKVVRYYNLIRSARPDWNPPEWLDVKGVTEAYEYLKFRNGDVPTSEWKALPEDDEGTVYLRNLGTPPMQVLTQSEINAESAIKTDEELAQSQINWKDLPAWQRFALATTMPGSSGITDRPEWTKLTAASINSLLMAAGVGKAVSAINPIAGVAAGLLLAGGLTYQSYTGTKIPVINEIILASNALSEGVERIIGVGKQTTVDGLDDVLGELPSAWKASQATYETGPTNYLNALAWISNVFTPDEKDSKLAGKDEVWRFEQGITTPVKLTGGAVKGAEYLSQSRDWIEQGKAQEEFNTAVNDGTFTGTYQEYIYNKLTEQYGITGVINDLVAQTILDPLNAMPFMTGKVGSATLAQVASSSSNPTVKRVAGTASVAFEVGTGKFAIDALPMGLQQVVAGITKQKSSQGIVGSLEIYRDWIRTGFYPDVVKNLPDDMRVHYDSLLKQGVNQSDIKVLGDTITWKDKTGAEQAFKGSGASKFVVPEIKDLSPLEKFIGGIDDEYGLKELRPTKGQSFFKKLTQLTPEAQTSAMMNIFHHNIATLMDIANGDPEKMGAALYKLAGKVEVKPGEAGESILKSPAAKAIQAAAQYALKDGDIIQTELTNWNMGAERRAMLTNIANALNETPAKVLEQFKDNPSAMAERLSKIAPEMKTTPEFLESTLNVFVGDNPMPWNVEQFQATLVNSFANKLDDFFKEKYGLSQESWVFRVSNALKGVQSLVLLGFNPAYFMNNWVNNVITRAADGVGGYMTPKQVNDFYTRLGIFPKDTGLSSFDEITGMVISKAKDAQMDMIDKAQKAISTVNKVGVFSRLSGKMEKAEGNQARVIAMTQFMDKTKKVGVGIGRMDVALENLLDTQYPGMKEKVYGAINAGMNMKEIEQSIFNQEYRPRVETIIDELGTKYDGNNPGSTRELLRKTNMIERMNDRLKNAKTPDDVDNAFYGLMDDFEEWVNKQTVNDLVSKAEETKNMVQSEKIPAVLQIMSDQAIDTGQKWINQRKDYEGLYDRLNSGEIDYDQFIKEIEWLDTKHQAEVRRANDVNLQAYKGIVDALGIDNEFTRGFITKISDINQTWQTFWETRRKLFKEYSQKSKRGSNEPLDVWRQRKNDLWERLQDTLEVEYNKATDAELGYQMEMDGNFVQGYADYTGWDVTRAAEYRKTIFDLRKQIVEAQKQMRKKTRGLSFEERDAEYKKFNPVYNQMIQKMKQFEHDGAYQLMNKPIPEARIDVPEVEKAVNPNVDSMELSDMSATPEELAAMKAQAKQMLGLSDEQLDTLYPKQIAQAVNQEIRRLANIKRLNDSAKAVVKAKITAEDIIMQADNAKRHALLHEQGMLARSDVESQLRKSFKNSSEAEIQATMTLIDKYIDQWSKKQGYAPTDGTRDAWYATHIKEIGSADDLNNALNQAGVSPKGSISFENDGRAVIRALNSPDVSTMVHEVGHIFLRDLSDSDLNTVAKFGGLVDATELKDMMIAFQSGELHQGMDGYSKYVQAEEAFARGWERYLAEGDAPTPALKSVFQKFTNWMMDIYTSLKKKSGRVTGFENTPLDVDINVKIDGVSLKDIFDRMFTNKADRAPSFDSLLSDRVQDIKGRGRNYRFSDADLLTMARKELLTELLGEYPDEAQARAFADSMTDYAYLKNGTKIDDVTIYDALEEAANDLNANPWIKTEYKQVKGARTTARNITDPTQELSFQYKVIDLDDLQTSDRWSGDTLSPNPNFPQEFQPRNRSEAQSVLQTDAIGRELVPDELLYDTKAIDRGAPIVGPDNLVESGNGRILGLARAANVYPDNFNAYRNALIAESPKYGIDPESYADMKKPVLVRERLTDVDRVKFVNDANKPNTLQMNDVEVAMNDATKITDTSLMGLDVLDTETIEGALTAARNAGFINAFMKNLSDNERGKLMNQDGTINAQGIQRIINALFTKVYPGEEGERLSRIFTMSMDNNVKSLESALMASLPQMAKTEGMIRSGARSGDLSITADIASAADKLASLRSTGMSVSDYLGQMTLFGDDLTPHQKVLLQFFGDQKSPKKIREFLREYATLVEKEPDPNQGVLFGESMLHTKEELLNGAINTIRPESGELFTGEPRPDAAITQTLPSDQLAQPDTGAAEGVRAAQTGSENIQGVDSSALAKSIIDAETKADYDAGQPVSIDRAGEIDISHRDILPVPEDVQNVIATADMFRFSKKQQAKDYVQWVIDGEKGARPDVSQDVIDSYVNSIDILRDYAVKKSSGITPSEIIKSEIIEPTNAELVKTAKNYTKDLPAEILEKVYHKAFDLIEENVEGGADTSYSRYKLYYKTAQELHSYLRDNIGKDPNITLERNGYKYSSDAGNIILEAPSHKGGGYYLDFSASTERVAKNIASQNGINQPGITIQKVFKFKHGDADCVANVYKDGELIAYATEAPLKDARIDQDTRLLGLDPNDPNRWVYEQGGEVKSVDSRKPEVENVSSSLTKRKVDNKYTSYSSDFGNIYYEIGKHNVHAGKEVAYTTFVVHYSDPFQGRKMVELNQFRTFEEAEGFVYNHFNETKRQGELFQDSTRTPADLAESIKNKSIDDMDLGELRYALTHDKLTGIKNRTAYESATKLPVQVVLDVEGLKYVNDNFGHPVGDDVLRALAKSVAEASDEAYRGSDRADEFIMQFNTEEEAQAAIAKVEQVLSEQKVTLNGEEWKGFSFSHGIGKTLAEADIAMNKNKTVAISEGKRANRGEKPVNLQPVDNTAAPMGKVPLDGTPVTEPFGRVLDEVNSEYIRPVLQDIRNAYKKKMAEGPTELGNMSKADVKTLRQYLNGTVAPDLSSVKRAALTYGDTMRNNALLDYSRRYGFDNVLNIVYPYQFWYTRSMMNWAKRMVDKPSWFAMYARLQQVQQKMERDGMPTRLKGKVRFSMPWMPEWMGGGLWTDPMAKIFPFDQFGQPFEQYSLNRNQVYKRAESIIDDMRSTEKITQDEASEALATRAGSAWERAVSQAEVELDKSSNPATLATMMMQPALWWNIASNVAQETPEKIGVMPITRTGQTIRELGSDTFLEPITDVVGGILASPEEKIREKAGLSQFGEWGDYYLDRTMASMAANGEITVEQARIAMIQRSGEVYDEAVSRVSQEQAIKQPGAAGIMALKEGAGVGQSVVSTVESIFGGSLYPEGEMKMRGLKSVYDNAWSKFKAGDDEAINQFFDDYPEYYARLALYDEPEERLHQFLVDSIWQKYTELDTANKRIARESLGDDFTTSFLNKETRDYEAIDDKTLAKWSQMLGTSELPEVDATTDAQKTQQIQYLPDEITTEINAYYDEKNKLFPSSTMWQNAYYDLPAGSQRKTFLAQHPELKEYWDWKKKYVEEHPEVGDYLEELKQDHTADEVSSELTSPLVRQLLNYAAGGSLSTGAKSELARIKEQIAPDMTYEEFVQVALSLVTSTTE